MANEEHLAILRQGTKKWNPWYYECPPVRSRLTAAVLLGLAACAGPVETRRTVPELARLGFGPASTSASAGGSVVEATMAAVPDEWASCGPALVGSEPRRMATAETERGAVRVELTPVGGGGTEVDVAAAFTGGYRHPSTTYRFERVCRSNGVLEARLLTAAAG